MRAAIIVAGLMLLVGGKVTAQTAKRPVAVYRGEAVEAKTSVPPRCLGNNLSQAEATMILVAHNNARAAIGLRPLKWDCSLASTAQSWAGRGIAGHSETDFGENIFVALDTAVKVEMATEHWLAESANWKNDGHCSPGKTCTHYTQIVWRGTALMGCGINRAASGKWPVILVCNYSPGSGPGPAY